MAGEDRDAERRQGFYSVAVYGGRQGEASGGHPFGQPFGPASLEDFEGALREAAGADGLVSDPALLGGTELGLRVSVEAENASDAFLRVVDLYRRAARAVYGDSPEIDEAEVVEQEKFERRESGGVCEELELVGQTEAAGILGVRPQRVGQLEDERSRGRREDFPAPASHVGTRPVWLREEIELFNRRWRRKRTGRPASRPPESQELRDKTENST